MTAYLEILSALLLGCATAMFLVLTFGRWETRHTPEELLKGRLLAFFFAVLLGFSCCRMFAAGHSHLPINATEYPR